MSTVEVPDSVKAIIERRVAEGRIASEADFLVEAARIFDSYLEEEATVVAAARKGIAAIERGDYITISHADDAARFRNEVWDEAKALRRGGNPSGSDLV